MNKSLIVFFLFALVLVSASTNKKAQKEKVTTTRSSPGFDFAGIRSFLDQATSLILDDRIFLDNTTWIYPPHLGLRFISEYFAVLHYLGLENQTAFNRETYKKIALSTQLENGSWKQLPDPMVSDGQIDSTILAYWALKIMGEDLNAPHMRKAREWILNYGGPDQASTLTKYFLSLFGQYDWEGHVYIPLMALRNESIYQYTFADNFVAQWVYPHLVTMAYLRYYKLGKDMGPRFAVQELYPEGKRFKLYNVQKPTEPEADILNILKLQFEIQQHNGAFGGYTVCSLFAMVAMKDFDAAYPGLLTDKINTAVKRAFEFLELTYITSPRAGYKGMLMDGSFWDNALIVQGLGEAGVPAEKLTKTLEYIIKNGQQKNGGFCYGFGFEYAPDTDDTAIAVQAMMLFGDKYKAQIDRAVDWLVFMQNKDGGFGAFHKEKNINPLVSYFAGKIADSAEIFDQSSVDLTSHVLETWALYGFGLDHPSVKKAIQYFKNEQKPFGSWEARWAVNYIHTAGNVVSSLSKIGYDVEEPWVRKAVDWMLSKQNKDGGWGESTLSYKAGANMEGVGVSTPTQTAWVLFGLIEIADKPNYNVTEQIFQGIRYLQSAHKKHGEWLDESPVGTGHRGILSMQYPAYAKAFPPMAISRFLNKFGEGKTCNPSNNYCRKTKIVIRSDSNNTEEDL